MLNDLEILDFAFYLDDGHGVGDALALAVVELLDEIYAEPEKRFLALGGLVGVLEILELVAEFGENGLTNPTDGVGELELSEFFFDLFDLLLLDEFFERLQSVNVLGDEVLVLDDVSPGGHLSRDLLKLGLWSGAAERGGVEERDVLQVHAKKG